MWRVKIAIIKPVMLLTKITIIRVNFQYFKAWTPTCITWVEHHTPHFPGLWETQWRGAEFYLIWKKIVKTRNQIHLRHNVETTLRLPSPSLEILSTIMTHPPPLSYTTGNDESSLCDKPENTLCKTSNTILQTWWLTEISVTSRCFSKLMCSHSVAKTTVDSGILVQ